MVDDKQLLKERTDKLDQILEEDFSGFDFAEWRSAEGGEAKKRFAHVSDTGMYAWVDFADTLETFDDFLSEGFEPVAVIDLDTGDRYEPILRWRKVEEQQ